MTCTKSSGQWEGFTPKHLTAPRKPLDFRSGLRGPDLSSLGLFRGQCGQWQTRRKAQHEASLPGSLSAERNLEKGQGFPLGIVSKKENEVCSARKVCFLPSDVTEVMTHSVLSLQRFK